MNKSLEQHLDDWYKDYRQDVDFHEKFSIDFNIESVSNVLSRFLEYLHGENFTTDRSIKNFLINYNPKIEITLIDVLDTFVSYLNGDFYHDPLQTEFDFMKGKDEEVVND